MAKHYECEYCGQEFASPWKNVKLCGPCRSLRDISAMGKKRTAKCEDCGTEFWPIRTSYRRCYKCTDLMAGLRNTPPCNVCHERNRSAPGVERTCLACVQSSSELRHQYALALRHRVERLKDPTTPE